MAKKTMTPGRYRLPNQKTVGLLDCIEFLDRIYFRVPRTEQYARSMARLYDGIDADCLALVNRAWSQAEQREARDRLTRSSHEWYLWWYGTAHPEDTDWQGTHLKFGKW